MSFIPGCVLFHCYFFALMQNEQSDAENIMNVVFKCAALQCETMAKFSIRFVHTGKAAKLHRREAKYKQTLHGNLTRLGYQF